VIVSLALTIEARDGTTAGHCQRLAQYASTLGRTLGLDEDDVAALTRGGFLHDVGKVGIPDAVLLKRGRLTTEEFALITQHPVIGERLCGELRSLRKVRPIVRHHHERLDGSGYPDQLRGDTIPLLAQIMGIVDVFDALTTDRPYRIAMPIARAADELRGEVACGWRRADLVNIFLDQVARG
jgi:putative two-component system response regulator